MSTSKDWVIDQGRVDSTAFFEMLPDIFPEATTFFVEGTSIEKVVVDCYSKYLQAGDFLPGANTLWPVSRKIRCVFDKTLFEELAILSKCHAERELLDHLFIYKEEVLLLEWHDAFSNIMILPSCFPEERVAALAKRLNLSYTRWDFL